VIGVDTNVIVRLLTRDDQVQYRSAVAAFETERVFIPTTVVLETEWVLRYAYDFEPQQVALGFEELFGLTNVELEHPLRVAQALEWHKLGLDFPDALHLAACADLQAFVTFDRKLISRGSRLIGVSVTAP
jgi:predicted nucleic-acid-binding protein